MSGLFVQKHVEAVRAQGVDVRVIHSQTWRDIWRQWRAIRREGWMPDVVQLNVIQKQGLLALWLKKRYHIPFAIIEHWSGYLPENGQFMRMAPSKRRLYIRLAEEAAVLLTVSRRHADAMRECGIQARRWELIRNVVDDFFYTPVNIPQFRDSAQKNILHISCFDERAKNVKGLLRAAKSLSGKRRDWCLTLVGTGVDYEDVRRFADTLDIPHDQLRWTGELTPQQVAGEFDKADFFVLPSNYENAPVVLSESLVKGVPVIATRVGGIPEMVNEQCGVLVTPGDENELAQAMENMLDNCRTFDRNRIRQAGEPYSYAAVGAQLKALYETLAVRS